MAFGPEEKRYFSLPRKWTAVHFLESTQAPAAQSVREMTREALAKPIGFPSLREMHSGGKRVAVIVDDGTRPTPASEILAALLPYLIEAGCPKEATTIVIALGTHAPHYAGPLYTQRLHRRPTSSPAPPCSLEAAHQDDHRLPVNFS